MIKIIIINALLTATYIPYLSTPRKHQRNQLFNFHYVLHYANTCSYCTCLYAYVYPLNFNNTNCSWSGRLGKTSKVKLDRPSRSLSLFVLPTTVRS